MALVSRLTKVEAGIADLRAGQARFQSTLEGVGSTLQLFSEQLAQLIELIEPGPAVEIIFTAEVDGQLQFGVTMLNLTDTQQATLSIQPVDKKGNPAPVDGVPVWASSNTEVLTVEPAADGMSAVAKAVGPLGSAVVSVKVDADLGSGVTELSGGLDVSVSGGGATSITVTAGTPEEQPGA